ncbi:MAG: glutamate-5-semialdehyde dehydrogenase [Phototrophicales bacterium]|nr:MAG: glutamate-5-semialdehyde dehydrogenase [Phototrophicales bacterium]
MTEELDLIQLAKSAKDAGYALAKATTEQKNHALMCIADALMAHKDELLRANQADLDEARANGTSEALLDRINLQKRLDGIINDIRTVASLPDPVGRVIEERVLPNGLRVSRRRTPIGVIGVIYEARPNVTIDIAVLSLKSGNACILRGGKDILRSNMAIIAVMKQAIIQSGLPADAVQLIASTDRKYVGEMLELHDYIDMIIPRGGADLHRFCKENSTIPVITGGVGICHLYVDESADVMSALEVIYNAKTSRPSVCNALDTVLVHHNMASAVLPRLVDKLYPAGVEFRAEKRAMTYIQDLCYAKIVPAGDDDFDTEWMALILGLKVVDSLDEAMAHIRQHSLGHSDGILTQNAEHAERFLNEVDSSAVFWNASTRFNDGGALGLGAEVAISTQKLHARGPMALEELTTYKWVVIGEGHIRK